MKGASNETRTHSCRSDCAGPDYFVSYPGYDAKRSDVEVQVMLKLWGMQSTPSLPLLPGPLCPGVVAPVRVLSVGQTELK